MSNPAGQKIQNSCQDIYDAGYEDGRNQMKKEILAILVKNWDVVGKESIVPSVQKTDVCHKRQ